MFLKFLWLNFNDSFKFNSSGLTRGRQRRMRRGGIWQVLEKDSKKKMIGIILNDSEKILKFFFD
jgi:hypothetical protein